MARFDADAPVQLSVLDRLIDDDPESPRDRTPPRHELMSQLRQSVRRDLEMLLNNRVRCLSWPADLTELSRSLVNFGVPDFTGEDMSPEDSRERFRTAVEQAIRRFEPRFKSVAVIIVANAEPLDRTLRFRIEALMYADPAPEAMVFDSLLDPAQRTCTVLSVSSD